MSASASKRMVWSIKEGFARVEGRSTKTRLGLSIRSSWNGTSASSSITTRTTSGRTARRIALMFTSFKAAAVVGTELLAPDDEGAGEGAGDAAATVGGLDSADTADGRC